MAKGAIRIMCESFYEAFGEEIYSLIKNIIVTRWINLKHMAKFVYQAFQIDYESAWMFIFLLGWAVPFIIILGDTDHIIKNFRVLKPDEMPLKAYN
jgi:hypothetical protein